MNAGGQGGVITSDEEGGVTIVDHAEGGIKQLDAQGAVIQEAVPPQVEEAVFAPGPGVIIINGNVVQGGFGAAPQANLPAGAAVAADMLDTFGAKLAEAEGGLRCTDVKVGTPADKLGLQVGDLITKVAGRDATKLDDVKDFLLKPDPEKPLKLDISRKGESHTLTAPAK
jgi:S1-C subfamily serine protease